jgi:hypothetical protein
VHLTSHLLSTPYLCGKEREERKRRKKAKKEREERKRRKKDKKERQERQRNEVYRN